MFGEGCVLSREGSEGLVDFVFNVFVVFCFECGGVVVWVLCGWFVVEIKGSCW